MNYELAKELKDAGFPMIERADEPSREREFIQKLGGTDRLDIVFAPTLSELIEACDSLVEDCVYLSGHKDSWSCIDGRDGFGFYGGDGATPIEAAARLWLALNKKV